MTCAHCQKPILDAKFYVLGLGAMAKQPDGTQVMFADDQAVGIFADVLVHDHDLDDGPSSIELLDGLVVRNAQAELTFCSKTCLKAWFAERVDRLADLTAR